MGPVSKPVVPGTESLRSLTAIDTSDPEHFFSMMRSVRPGHGGYDTSTDRLDWRAEVKVMDCGVVRVAAIETEAYRFHGTSESLYFGTLLRGSVEVTRRNRTETMRLGMTAPQCLDHLSVRIGPGFQGISASCSREDLAGALGALWKDDCGLLLRAVESAPESCDFSVYDRNMQSLNRLTGGGNAAFLAEARFRREAGDILLLSMARAMVSRLTAGPKLRARRHLARAINYIDIHFAEDLRISSIAEAAGCSIRLLQDLFAAVDGRTIVQHITARRLAHARRLLLAGATADTVTTAALDSGFSHFGLFAQHYRAAFGELPSETRRNVLSAQHIFCAASVTQPLRQG